MEEDNAYPISGEYIEPPSRQRARDKERGEVLQALPKLQEVVDRFKERIDFYKSIESIPEEVLTSPDEFMHLVTAYKLTAGTLQNEMNWLEGLIDDNKR